MRVLGFMLQPNLRYLSLQIALHRRLAIGSANGLAKTHRFTAADCVWYRQQSLRWCWESVGVDSKRRFHSRSGKG